MVVAANAVLADVLVPGFWKQAEDPVFQSDCLEPASASADQTEKYGALPSVLPHWLGLLLTTENLVCQDVDI